MNALKAQKEQQKPKPPTDKITTDDPELAARFDRVLTEAVETLEESGLKYMFIGGMASGALGRPRSTHDIDVFVRPEDSELALRAFEKNGFHTERTDPAWLYKAYKENILIDVIFKSKGEIYMDNEMVQRTITAEFHGRRLKLVAPEDLIIIKAAAHSELTPGHWHDAIALLSHQSLDWDYLIKRARRAPRRVLSLLIYAQSADVWVPNSVVQTLYQNIFGEQTRATGKHGLEQPSVPNVTQAHPGTAGSRGPLSVVPQGALGATRGSDAQNRYQLGHLRERLAQDTSTCELDIRFHQSNDTLFLHGDVATRDRSEAVERIAHEMFPEQRIENRINVTPMSEPTEAEEVK